MKKLYLGAAATLLFAVSGQAKQAQQPTPAQ